jgi:hypothetical protein
VRVAQQKTAGTLIDLVRARLGGSTATNHSPIKRIQDLGGVLTLHQGLGGYTRRVRSRAPTRKNHDATTPVQTNLWESDHTLTQRLEGYCRYQQYGGTHIHR